MVRDLALSVMNTSIANTAVGAETPQRLTLPFEPLPQFRKNALEESAARADNRGKRIGIFIVA